MGTSPAQTAMTQLEAPGGIAVTVQGGSPRDVNAVRHQLHAKAVAAARHPDLYVRFDPHARGVSVDWTSTTRATWSLSAPPNAGRVRYINQLLRLRLLDRGRLPIHAAAAEQDDGAWMIVGPAGGGKTALLLALLDAGWSFLAGEWVVVEDGRVQAADDRIDLRAHHLDAARSLRLELGLRGRVRRWLVATGLRRLDRFELRSRDLGNSRISRTGTVPITRAVWVQGTSGPAHGRDGSLDEIVDEMVRCELSRYRDLLALYQHDVAGGIQPVPLVRDLGEMLNTRIRQQLAGIRVRIVERAGAAPHSLLELAGVGIA